MDVADRNLLLLLGSAAIGFGGSTYFEDVRLQRASILIGLGGFGLWLAERSLRKTIQEAPHEGVILPSSHASKVAVGDQAIVKIEPSPIQAPPIPRVPANATGLVIQVQDVTASTISGPVVAYTLKPAWYSGDVLNAAYGEVFEPLRPPSAPVTVLRTSLHSVRKKASP